MRELAVAVWSHGSAAVHVGIDEGSERLGRFDPRVQLQPELGSDREVGAAAGGDDDLVEVIDGADLVIRAATRHRELGSATVFAGMTYLLRPEIRVQLQPPALGQFLQPLPESAACGQPVARA